MSCWRNELLTQKGDIRSKVIKGTSVHHNNIAGVEEKELNYCSDYSLDFAFFQVVSWLADHLGNPRLGMKSEDSDYQGSSEKTTFNFRQMVPIQ